MVGAGASVGNASLGCISGEDLLGGNGVKRRVAVGTIALREALYVHPKASYPLEVNNFDWVVWRFGVENLMGACSTQWRLYASESSVDLVGIAALSLMRLTVVLLKSLSRLAWYGFECRSLNGRSASRVISLFVLAKRVNVGKPIVVAPFLITNEQ